MRTTLLIAAFCLTLAAPGEAALAQQPTRTAAARRCCRVPAGTVVMVELAEPVSTKTHKAGDRFPIRLAAPVIVDGQVVLPAGTPGVGHVVQASGPGLGGKGAKLVVSARLPDRGRRDRAARRPAAHRHGQGPLHGRRPRQPRRLDLHAAGLRRLRRDRRRDRDLRRGPTPPPRSPAPSTCARWRRQPPGLRPGPGRVRPAQQSRGWIEMPPPPRGMAQVVFFRAKSLAGTGQWFNVRENGQALGKLTNGAYFVVVAARPAQLQRHQRAGVQGPPDPEGRRRRDLLCRGHHDPRGGHRRRRPDPLRPRRIQRRGQGPEARRTSPAPRTSSRKKRPGQGGGEVGPRRRTYLAGSRHFFGWPTAQT